MKNLFTTASSSTEWDFANFFFCQLTDKEINFIKETSKTIRELVEKTNAKNTFVFSEYILDVKGYFRSDINDWIEDDFKLLNFEDSSYLEKNIITEEETFNSLVTDEKYKELFDNSQPTEQTIDNFLVRFLYGGFRLIGFGKHTGEGYESAIIPYSLLD